MAHLLQKIRARHIFGLIMVALAIGIALRPLGTVIFIESRFGIPPIPYAAMLAISGTLLALFNFPLWARALLTLTFVIYLIGTLELTASSESRPFTALILYNGLYVMTLYFMVKEN